MKRLLTDRPMRLWTLLAVLLIAADVWAWQRLSAARHRAEQARAGAVRCEYLADQIMRLRPQASFAASRELQATELAAQVEAAARVSRVPPANIVRISPQSPTRLEESVYLERPTQLQLRQVTLQQLMTFLSELVRGAAGLRATTLRLTAPRDQASGAQWNAELTVSYLLYAPRTTDPKGRQDP